MGNACCNGEGNKDTHTLEDKKGTSGGKPIKMDPKVTEQLMTDLKKHINKIIKI
jgi:hypothetical protein